MSHFVSSGDKNEKPSVDVVSYAKVVYTFQMFTFMFS